MHQVSVSSSFLKIWKNVLALCCWRYFQQNLAVNVCIHYLSSEDVVFKSLPTKLESLKLCSFILRFTAWVYKSITTTTTTTTTYYKQQSENSLFPHIEKVIKNTRIRISIVSIYVSTTLTLLTLTSRVQPPHSLYWLICIACPLMTEPSHSFVLVHPLPYNLKWFAL